ncbi:beta strand repeat-containing protein [Schlesneria sp. DSM 10557]|uniref:beta strand repeat-containing protein n=1 Tax=Schlesneria sp. DSM 10557 TaxID=3044399 RepID=UPI0035A04561
MLISKWLAAFRPRHTVRSKTRRGRQKLAFACHIMLLEDRILLSFTPVLTNTANNLHEVLYTLAPEIPADIPVKYVTIMNNSPDVVYPIFIGANSTMDNTAGQVVRIELTNGGSGYDPANPPLVKFEGGSGSGAFARASVNAEGQVYALTLGLGNLPIGSGYTSAPTITFDDSANGNKGRNAAATATISTAGSYTKPTSQYDPLDPFNQGFRGYIGEVNPNNPNEVIAGLQPYSQVTIQLPLVFWDGARIFMATNGSDPLESASDPGNPIQSADPWQYNFSAKAYIPAPGAAYSATFPDPATGIANSNGRVLWYHDSNVLIGGPKGFANDTPGQLTEFTIRDEMQVNWAPNMPQSELVNPILNYDVSYVDQLGLPAMMETTDGFPKTNPELGPKPYAGIGADLSVPQMQQLIAQFTQTIPGTPNSLLGDYFGGKGYDQYVFPGSLSDFSLLPGGFNVFADSALADSESTYNTAQFQHFKLVSGGTINRVATGNINGNGVVTVGSNVVTGLDPSVVQQLAKGMIILDSGSGPGAQGNYFSAGTYIESINLANNSVTLSTPAYFDNSGNSGGTFALTFLGSRWNSSTGATDGTQPRITGLDPEAVQFLSPGMLVTGPGITGYAVIQSINGLNEVTLVDVNQNPFVPAAGTGSSGSPYVFAGSPASYVAQKLINLWYAWADYYVQNVDATTVSLSGKTTGTNSLLDEKALILSDLSDTSQLRVGSVVSGPNIALNRVSDAQVHHGGTGYQVGDILTVSGGATIAPFGAAQIKVLGVNSAGALTAIQVIQSGSYSQIPAGIVSFTGGQGSGATANLTISNTTITKILSATSVQLSNAVLTSATGTYTFSAPLPIVRSSDAPAFGDPANKLTFDNSFTAPYGENPLEFAQTVYDVMSGFSKIPPSGAKLSLSAQLLSYCIGCNIGSFAGNSLVPVLRQDQLRDALKSIMRGVSDFQQFPEFGTIQDPRSTSQWYPDPSKVLLGALVNETQTTSNVFNLNPYVFFVHRVLGMNGYGFSVDDDTADVGSLGSNLQIAYGSTAATAPGTTQKLNNLNYYTSGAPYGTLVGEGQIDNTSVAFAKMREEGFLIPGNTDRTPVTVIKLPTSLIPLLVAADQNTTGALVTASDNSLPAGTRVVAYQNSVSDPSYPEGYGAVFVSRPAGTVPATDGPPNTTFTLTGFNTLLPVITQVSQTSGAPGTQITITGAQFGYTLVGSTNFVPVVESITFNGIPAAASSIIVVDANTVKVTLPQGASAGKIAVRSDAGTGYSTTDFQVTSLQVSQPPTGAANTIAINKNTSYPFAVADFGFSDPNDNPSHNFSAVQITSLPTAGTLTYNGIAVSQNQFVSVADISAGKLVFTPALNAVGASYSQFAFKVQDDGSTENGGGNLGLTEHLMKMTVLAIPGVNPSPWLGGIESTPLSYKPNDPPKVISETVLASDPNSQNLTKLTVQITSGYQNDANGKDVLSFTNQFGITGSFDAATGTLTLSGTAYVGDYRKALRTVTFSSTGSNVSSANRVLTIIATDDGSPNPALSQPIKRTVVFNFAPVITGLESANLTYAANTPATVISSTIDLSDADSTLLSKVTVQITSGYQNNADGQDLLSFTDKLGITGSFNPATGTLTLSGSATAASYRDALRSVTYSSTGANVTTANRVLTIIATDDKAPTPASSAPVTRTITAANHRPWLGGIESAPLTYKPNDPPKTISDTVLASDPDSHNLTKLTVQITSGYQNDANGKDLLSFTSQFGITGLFDAATGTLTLSGTAYVGDYRKALRTVTFSSTGSNVSSANRVLTIIATDDGSPNPALSLPINRTVVFNFPPVISGLETANLVYSANAPATVISSTINVTDSDSAKLSKVTLQITSGYQNNADGQDLLSFTNQLGITGSFNPATGTLTLTGEADAASYRTALRSVTYSSTGANVTTADRVITIIATDNKSPTPASSTPVTRTIAAVNHRPWLGGVESAPLTYKPNDPPKTISDTVLASDPDSHNLTKLTVQITSGYQNDANGKDLLSFTSQFGITGSFDAATGTLTLSGTAYVGDYRKALRTVTFSSTGSNVSTNDRVLTMIASDDSLVPALSIPITRTIKLLA